MRLLRSLLLFELGVLTGVALAAVAAKRALPSRGDEESDDVALAAVFGGVELANRSKTFKGGSLLAWFGGIDLDLREAELAPGAKFTASALFGGINVTTPPGWRVESAVQTISGGVAVDTPAGEDPEAPVLTLDGTAMLGGINVGAKKQTADQTAGS